MMNRATDEALAAAMKQMGSEGVEAGFLEFLRQNGYQPKSDLSAAQRQKLVEGDVGYDLEGLANVPQDCDAPEESVDDLQERSRRLFEKVPSFLVQEILDQCGKYLPEKIESYREKIQSSAENPEFTEEERRVLQAQAAQANALKVPFECSKWQLYELKEAARRLNHLKGQEKRKGAGAALVSRYAPVLFKLRELSVALDRWPYRTRTEDIQRETCIGMKSLMRSDLAELRTRYLGRVARSKPVIASILAATYGPARKETVSRLYRQVRAEALRFIDEELGALPNLRGTPEFLRLREGTAALWFAWQEMPEDPLFRKDPDFPLPILDLERLPGTDPLWVFGEPELSFFREMNASYHSASKVGEVEDGEHVTFLPMINLLAEQSPLAAQEVMAHEIGHRFGSVISIRNGYDLTGHLAGLTACLRSENSIGMAEYQADEALADWISAKIMGRIIKGLPPQERRAAALAVNGFSCEAYGASYFKGGFSVNDSHPDVHLRVNGIMGANGDIREALGCGSVKGSFVECTLEGAKVVKE